MTSQDMLEAHVHRYDQLVRRLREILLEPNYTNEMSPEVKKLLIEIPAVAREGFAMKQVLQRADHYAQNDWKP